jgi:hypothetical protein
MLNPLFNTLEYCRQNFVVGNVYNMQVVSPEEETSKGERGHFFGCVKEAWENLHEADKQFKSKDHFRHWVVIQAGYYTCQDFTELSASDAERKAATLGTWVHKMDPYAIVTIRGSVVRVYRARSLKTRGPDALTKAEFHDMHEKALVIMSDLIGTDVAALLMQALGRTSPGPAAEAEPATEAEPMPEWEESDPLLRAYNGR